MSEPLRRLSITQFRLLLADASVLTRRIDAVHLHHTWKPSRSDFRGAGTIEAMRRFHRAQGWVDIAQHLTIDPEGGLWTGRNWNLPPASAKGHNGTPAAGPFMLEIVGNFDEGCDPFDGAQREAAVAVTAHILETCALQIADVKFHRELVDGLKTCPGSAFDRATFEALMQGELSKKKKRPAATAVFPREFLAGAAVTAPVAVTVTQKERESATVPEHEAAAQVVERDARNRVAAAQRRYSHDFSRLMIDRSGSRGEDWTALKPHVVNLSRGELSDSGGEFTTTAADLDGIIDAIRDRAAGDPALRVLLYAHGGLVGESDALAHAKTTYRWWLDKGVYPVYFVWETALLEVLRQRLFGARDFLDWTSDAAIELAAKGPGTLIWSEMKSNARRASAADLGEGYPGGAFLFARKLAGLLKSADGISLHAIGHSAGAIFHAHLLPALLGLGVRRIETLSLLAPAARAELFAENLLPLITAGRIGRHTCFTMDEDAEEQDDCWTIYRKSLLYLVSHSFEGLRRRPILGLHRSIRKDAALRAFYGLDEKGRLDPAGSPKAEIQFSYARDRQENPLTRALAHGAFDNDPKTMAAALRRILNIADDTGVGEDDFPFPPLERTFEIGRPDRRPDLQVGRVEGRPDVQVGRADGRPDLQVGLGPAEEAAASEPYGDDRSARRRRALCVGIDKYRDRPLEGCVNDANAWGRVLEGLGFSVAYLRNAQATNRRIQEALRELIASASPGDVLVFQYSGHGTQLADDNGDENDGFDEAFVPVDYHKGQLLLRDDLVAKAIEGLPDGATLTLFMDCCHCGTNSRFAPATRAAETPTDRIRYMPPELLGEARAWRRARGSHARPSSAPGVIHLAACRDDEYAWESRGQGDFTAAATAFLADAAERGDTNEAFIKQVAKIVAARGRQHPMMMPPARGMARRPILTAASGASAEPTPARPAPAEPASAEIDAQLLAHLEAAVTLLRARVGANRAPGGE